MGINSEFVESLANFSNFHRDRKGHCYFYFSSGGKKLELCLTPNSGEAETYVTNVLGGKHVPGETTAAYRFAAEFIQTEANILNKPIKYSFNSGDPRMVKWAQEKGREIFNWDVANKEEGSFGKTFFPRITKVQP